MKSVLWRVAKRLSYTEDAWCLKVNFIFQNSQRPQNETSDTVACVSAFME